MLSLRSFARNITLAVIAAFIVPRAVAQDAAVPDGPGALKAVVAQHINDIAAADSAMDVPRAISLRMMLAALSKPKEAQALYAEALRLADSTGRVADEMEARKALARTFAARGQMKQAFEEAMLAADRSAEWLAQQAEVSGARMDSIVRSAALERDSLLADTEAARRDAAMRINEADEQAEFWMWVAAGTAIVALLALVIVLLVNARSLRRQRAEIQQLRSDLDGLIQRSQNRVRTTSAPVVPVPPPPPPTTAVVDTPAAPPADVDSVVRAMFHKQAPERMAALRDARTRGDHAKVQRVVHTLKPQLVNFDPALAALCARITKESAWNDAPGWNSDLDALERAVGRILAV